MLRCLLVARKENLTGVSTGLTGRSKNLDPTGFYLCTVLRNNFFVKKLFFDVQHFACSSSVPFCNKFSQ